MLKNCSRDPLCDSTRAEGGILEFWSISVCWRIVQESWELHCAVVPEQKGAYCQIWSCLWGDLKSMVVSKFIDIKKSKVIIWIMWLKVRGNKKFPIYGNEICSPVDGVNMNNRYFTLVSLIELWMYQPHPSVLIRPISNIIKPVDYCAWIIITPKVEKKKDRTQATLSPFIGPISMFAFTNTQL